MISIRKLLVFGALALAVGLVVGGRARAQNPTPGSPFVRLLSLSAPSTALSPAASPAPTGGRPAATPVFPTGTLIFN